MKKIISPAVVVKNCIEDVMLTKVKVLLKNKKSLKTDIVIIKKEEKEIKFFNNKITFKDHGFVKYYKPINSSNEKEIIKDLYTFIQKKL